MAATLRINGRDYSPYLKLFTEESVGVVDAERLSPQFAGNAALSEGAVWIGTSSVNKHWTIGVIVRGASLTVDSVNQMVRDIRGDLYRGAVVEYAPDGASQTTFFELEAGEFRPNYNHPRYRHGYVEGVLELWTRPYGNTGTWRTIASTIGTGPQVVAATGVLGDVAANTRLSVSVPSMTAAVLPATAPFGFLAYGFARGTYQSVWPAASAIGFDGTATKFGASGALASGYIGETPGLLSPSLQPLAQFSFAATQVPAGRHRVFAIVNQRFHSPSAVALRLDTIYWGVNATAMATQNAAGKWQVVDLGEITQPATPSGFDTDAIRPEIMYAVATSASVVASPALRLAGLVLVPIDQGRAGVVLGGSMPLPPRFKVQDGRDSYARLTDSTSNSPGWDVLPRLRGDLPKIDPTGSPVASGARQLIVFAGNVEDYRANDRVDVQVSVREQFSFYR